MPNHRRDMLWILGLTAVVVLCIKTAEWLIG
jgi:hypothetical protein